MSNPTEKADTITLTNTNEFNKPVIYIFVAGIGAVGGTLIEQIESLRHPLFELKLLGICNSRFAVWNSDDQSFEELKAELDCGEPTDWKTIPQRVVEFKQLNTIFVDATGSVEAAQQYDYLLENGIHIATPSKRGNTFEQTYFNKLKDLSSYGDAYYRYETSVGAGLPVISTIRGLIDSGDEITEISGVVSGTMTYLFTQLEEGKPFSQAVRQAKAEGYSEPDPRDDLSGEDVARKFLILARTSGYTFERSELKVASLVPKPLSATTLEGFLDEFEDCDPYWKERDESAKEKGHVLRYTGTLTPEGVKVGVREFPSDSPIGGLKGTDNLIQIRTKRYADSPIIVQGPGAGKAVTAAGVLADVIEIARAVSI